MNNTPVYIGAAIVILIVGLFLGFIIVGAPMKYTFVFFMIVIGLAFITQPLARVWEVTQNFKSVYEQETIKENDALQRQHEQRLKKLDTERRKLDAANGALSDDDFDPATKQIIEKAVKDAKQQNAKVSVPGLLGEITKNIK